MPANLTPEYKKAEEKYRRATKPEDKLLYAQEMLKCIPKHKGTDHLQGDIKKRISQLKSEIKEAKSSKSKRFEYFVEKHGAAQIVLVGPPNSGKSRIMSALTNTDPEVADYMFTTREPLPGMIQCEDVQIELVDLPPVSEEYTPYWVYNIIRPADFVFLIIDFKEDDILEQVESTVKLLEEKKIILVKEKIEPEEQDIHNAFIQTIILANKFDHEAAAENLELFKELYRTDIPILPVSSLSGENMDFFKSRKILDLLDVIRVYSKSPSKEPELDNPFILQNGGTIMDFARKVHHDFEDNLKFAKVWGSSKFDGQQVDREYVLKDKDVVELHI